MKSPMKQWGQKICSMVLVVLLAVTIITPSYASGEEPTPEVEGEIIKVDKEVRGAAVLPAEGKEFHFAIEDMSDEGKIMPIHGSVTIHEEEKNTPKEIVFTHARTGSEKDGQVITAEELQEVLPHGDRFKIYEILAGDYKVSYSGGEGTDKNEFTVDHEGVVNINIVNELDEPAETQPGETETPPGETGTPPEETGTPPGGTDTPSGGTDTPPGGTDTPLGGTDTPLGGTDTPPGGTDTSSGGTDTPPETTATPTATTKPTAKATPKGGNSSSGGKGEAATTKSNGAKTADANDLTIWFVLLMGSAIFARVVMFGPQISYKKRREE